MVDLSCVVKKALESLTNTLGIGRKYVAFSNLDDEYRTEKLFKMLIDKDETFNPDLIYEWAINNEKWQEDEAEKLATISDLVLRDKVKISSIPYWKEDLLSDLREECNKGK